MKYVVGVHANVWIGVGVEASSQEEAEEKVYMAIFDDVPYGLHEAIEEAIADRYDESLEVGKVEEWLIDVDLDEFLEDEEDGEDE